MKLHNTLTGQLEELETNEAGVVKLYTCGLTVYSQPHIGNWLGYVYWDVLVRALQAEGYDVKRTQNITDVGHLTSDDDAGEDKMEKGARTEGKTAWDIAEKYIATAEHEGYDLLGLVRPTHLVRATDYIDEQIDFARELESKGFTYFIENEGLYFDTSKLNDYGKLARLDVAGLQAGKRVAVNGKRLVTDFALWKLSPKSSRRDMEWDSPWGTGFPGWHLECSVIARETLGDTLDIHTGGIDHIPVHHTNEIAQSESRTGQPFSKMWLHNNHIKVNGTKISKSLGNTITLEQIMDRGYDLNAFKLLTLSKHYRTEGNFDWDILDAASNRLRNWRSIAVLRHQTHNTSADDQYDESQVLVNVVKAALTNDLDTPNALAAIDRWLEKIERMSLETISALSLAKVLYGIRDLLGIDIVSSTPDISDAIKSRISERSHARDAKDWQLSDKIRDELIELGIELRDTENGTIWSHRS